MKFASALAIASLFFLTGRAASINGQNYVSLTDWARGNGFYGYTLRRGDEIVLTNKTSRMVFDVNSHDAIINGVKVRLSLSVASQKNVPLISQLDLDTAIRPLIFPQKPSAKKITTICIDPGHGGKDSGNRVRGFFWHNEKTYTFQLATELRDELKKLGFNVILTRSNDTFVELASRPDIANRRNADLFISLHFNAIETGKNEVQGPEIYCITPVGAASSNAQGEGSGHSVTAANRNENKSLLLAYQVQKSLVKNLGVEDRSVRRARFAVLRDAEMPAILVEGGYMSNPREGKKIFDSAYRKQMAAAVVKGIMNYKKLADPAPVPGPVTGSNKPSSAKKSE